MVHSTSTSPRYESSAFGDVAYLDGLAVDDPEVGRLDRPVSNSATSPDALVPQSATVPLRSRDELIVNLPSASWNVIVLPASAM